MPVIKRFSLLICVILLIWFGIEYYPYLLFKVSEWQRAFNLSLSSSLKSLKQHSDQAGWSLILVSFLYGAFHAVGPGHGKFILTSYLSLSQTKLPKAIKITLLSALVQGFIAIGLVTLLVVLFSLSRSYFNLTLKWVERGSFVVMVLFGLYFCYQGIKVIQSSKRRPQKSLQIQQIRAIQPNTFSLKPQFHSHSGHCQCGHKHLPSALEMEQVTDWKSTAMLILSIGLRPCSGAILVLFLAYTLDIYGWGVLSALAMAFGTGLTLTLFACLVLFARHKAIQTGQWYLSLRTSNGVGQVIKIAVGITLVVFGVILFHSSLLDTSSNLLFKR